MAGRSAGLAAGVAAVALAVAGCATESGTDVSQRGGTLTILATDPPGHLDPGRVSRSTDLLLSTRLLHRTLTTYPAESGGVGKEVVPDLAEDTGDPNGDATEWTFTLKEGLTYTDGTPIRAQDIEWAVERTFAPGLDDGLPYARDLLAGTQGYEGPYDGDDLASVTATDDRTIVFELRRPSWDFPSVVALPQFAPVPEALDTRGGYDRGPLTSGPYRIESDGTDRLTLERSDLWTRDDVRRAYPDRVEIVHGLTSEEVSERLIASEGSDATAISAQATETDEALARVVSDQEVLDRSARGLTGALNYLSMTTTEAPFQDLRVRQAMQYAVDRKAVADAAGGSVTGGDPTTTILTPQIPGRRGHDNYGAGPTGDPAQARELLALTAFPDGFGAQMLVRDSPREVAVARALKRAYDRVNINLKLRVLPADEYERVARTPSGQPQLILARWQPDWPRGSSMLPPMFDGRLIRETGNTNLSLTNSLTLNGAMDVAAEIEDVGEGNAAWADLDETTMDLAPIVPLLSERALYLAGTEVGNVFVHARYGAPDPAVLSVRGSAGGADG